MGSILFGTYAIGGLVCIVYVLAMLWDVIKKRKKLEDCPFSKRFLAFFAFMIAFAPFYWYTEILTPRVPDGKYRIDVSVSQSPEKIAFYLPAEITIQSDVDYEDDSYYLGAVEMNSSKAVLNRRFTLEKLYWRDDVDSAISICDEVYPETDVQVADFYDHEYLVNIGIITPETLGLTTKDQWESMTFPGKVEPLAVAIFAGLGLACEFKCAKKK